MKKLVFATLLLFTIPVFAQGYIAGALRIDSSSNPDTLGDEYMPTVQKDRSAFMPLRLAPGQNSRIGNLAYEEMTYLKITQPTSGEVPDKVNLQTRSLPPLNGGSGNCSVPPFVCSMWFVLDYQAAEFNTYDLSRVFYDNLNWQQRDFAYGPFATPKRTYLVVAPDVAIATSLTTNPVEELEDPASEALPLSLEMPLLDQ